MVRILLHGAGGAMGRTITQLAAEMDSVVIAAGVDVFDRADGSFPIFSSLESCTRETDVVVDFSSAKAADHLVDFCAEKKMPLVLCTTGLSNEQLARVKAASEQTAILRSANMSLGINTLMVLLKEAAKVLAGSGFDVEIVEKHHNRKVDAPSGTALALADSINEAMGGIYGYCFDRSQEKRRRQAGELGISSVRGGTIVGEHEVLFCGPDEVINFSHIAYSKAVFGKGALEAAAFLAGKPAGLYTMLDVIEGRVGGGA